MNYFLFNLPSPGKARSGFTLVELVLYLAIAAVVLSVTSATFVLVLESRTKDETIAVVDQEGTQAMQMMTRAARSAQTVSPGSPGATSSMLTLTLATSSRNPTVFNLATGTIRISEAAGPFVPITSNRVFVSSLLFQNLSAANTSGTVRMQFTLDASSSLGGYPYSYRKTFYGSGTLR